MFALQLPVGAAIGSLIDGWGRELIGWHAALLIVGMPGVLLAVLVWRTLREPTRGYWTITATQPRSATVAGAPSTTFSETLRLLIRLPSFRHTVIGYSIWVCVAAAQGFDALYLERSFGLGPGQVGTLAFAAGLFAIVGYFLGSRTCFLASRTYFLGSGPGARSAGEGSACKQCLNDAW